MGDVDKADPFRQGVAIEVVTEEMLEAGMECFFTHPDQVEPTMSQLKEILRMAYLRMRQVQRG